MILVVTHSADITADLVIRHLHRMRAAYLRLDTDMLGTPACHFGFSDSGPWLAALGQRWHPDDVRAVWYRRFVLPQSLERVEPEMRTFVQRELSAVLEAFVASITGLQVNPAEADRRAGNRLLQALAARQIGLDVPATLVTQREPEARSFLQAHDGGITKAVSFGQLGDSSRVAFTTGLTCDADLTGLDVCPSLFQQRVLAARQWRVTIVGARVFAARTKEGRGAALDWRRAPDHYALFEAATLPHAVEAALLELMRRGGLSFGAHDLIETPDNRFVFLETNPAGQWGWLELSLGLPIGEAVAALLMRSEGPEGTCSAAVAR